LVPLRVFKPRLAAGVFLFKNDFFRSYKVKATGINSIYSGAYLYHVCIMETQIKNGYSFQGNEYIPTEKCHLLSHYKKGLVLHFPKNGLYSMLFLEALEFRKHIKGVKINHFINDDGISFFEAYNFSDDIIEMAEIADYLNLNS
jgi:hypothetical protein